jgi:hypothetical protein
VAAKDWSAISLAKFDDHIKIFIRFSLLDKKIVRSNPNLRNHKFQWRASPHCMVVNLVRSGRKQPQLFFASAGVRARHPFLQTRRLQPVARLLMSGTSL